MRKMGWREPLHHRIGGKSPGRQGCVWAGDWGRGCVSPGQPVPVLEEPGPASPGSLGGGGWGVLHSIFNHTVLEG